MEFQKNPPASQRKTSHLKPSKTISSLIFPGHGQISEKLPPEPARRGHHFKISTILKPPCQYGWGLNSQPPYGRIIESVSARRRGGKLVCALAGGGVFHRRCPQ